jgi:glycosyltransferase involved in cell wall biosynthesis
MKKLVIASNLFNEIDQLGEWFDFVEKIADYVLIVDTGSTDGTIQYCEQRKAKVIIDDIIIREGYGPARNHLRESAKHFFPDAHWLFYLDADERINESDFHRLRFIKDYLIDTYDVVGFPRIDWLNKERTESAKDVMIYPDWQARMTRLNSPLQYVRRLHEQIVDCKNIYTNIENPKINHFHRSAGQDKRDRIGKICAYLHNKDSEWGHTYPKHHKEDMYLNLYEKEGF